jgi:hypothetical protein
MLIANWKRELRRLWSIRMALFFGALNGAVLGLAAFIDIINPWTFLVLNVLGYAAIAVARLLKQPGA